MTKRRDQSPPGSSGNGNGVTGPGGDSIGRDDAADYIRGIVSPLIHVALDNNLEVVAYLLKLATEEAGLKSSVIDVGRRTHRDPSA